MLISGKCFMLTNDRWLNDARTRFNDHCATKIASAASDLARHIDGPSAVDRKRRAIVPTGTDTHSLYKIRPGRYLVQSLCGDELGEIFGKRGKWTAITLDGRRHSDFLTVADAVNMVVSLGHTQH
jgi:hypothetical protein